ncbi:hypothetical protein BpHYR1_030046 [Brachionus plicatilis]|uniref:Uncharacterized protein n=1 Tax=Brachionus plicatilis TaxID=10195 RepID=A0A3M7P708_BRAPC|nr:hypothetical protein BpHYR1_030046 [Brachionus plicatilis]
MQSRKNNNEFGGYFLIKIQNLIKTFKHDNINLNDKDKSIHVEYNKRLDLFVMDSLTRCLNIKKSTDKDQITTHCAVYFKLNFSIDAKIQKVKKLIITSNKNAQKLKQRCKDLFSLIGYEIDDKLLIHKTNIKANFLNVLNFKFSNLSQSLNHCLEKFNLGPRVEFGSDGSEVFEQWAKHMEHFMTINLIDLDEKTKNAYRDSALFYFYLTIFYYFMEDSYCFENTELIIFDPNNTPLYGLHCEIQLVSKYLNEIDQNNNYISISSDCCVLCNLVLKNLGLKYYGAKSNMCSSRFWKLPRFDHEIIKYQSDRIDCFYKKLCQDLELVYNLLKDKNYKEDNKIYSEEIPYSDEWIDNQYIYWKRLLEKKVNVCSMDLSEAFKNDNDLCEVLKKYADKMKKFCLIVLGVLLIISHINAQYFSATDGITVGRLGKRSYLYNLLKLKPSTLSSAQVESDSSVNRDDFRQIDKLSTMRKFYKQFSKRLSDFEYDENESSEESFLNQHNFVLPKELFKKYFLKK